MSKIKENYVGALDIGTNKCCALLGVSRSNNELEIIGFGERATDGAVLKGDILDMELLMTVFSEAMSEAEQMANVSFADTYCIALNVSGSTMSFVPSVGSVTIKNPDQRITENDYIEACENAERYNSPPNKSYLGMCESYSFINSSKQVTQPIGQAGYKLDVHVLLQYIGSNELANIRHLGADLGIDDARIDTIFSGIAGAYGCLSESEKNNGTLLVDFGAGTTEYMVLNDGVITHAGVLPLGMDHVINDLSIGLKLPFNLCRQFVEQGRLEQLFSNSEDYWEVEIGRNIQQKSAHAIEAVVNARLQEIFNIIKSEIYKKNIVPDISSGGVLIGGGALLSRSRDIFRDTFKFNVRIGSAIGMTGNIGNLSTPQYGTTYGLLKFAHTCCLQNELPSKNNNPVTSVVNNVMNIFSKVKDSIKL